MSDYAIFTDAGACVPVGLLEEYSLHGIPMHYLLAETGGCVRLDDPAWEERCAAFYQSLRERADVSTSQITPFAFEEAFAPVLEAGQDILYCCFSSGLSSTWGNTRAAAEELSRRFPGRTVRCVDSLSAAGGQGLFTLQAAVNRRRGMSLEENAQWLEARVQRVCHWFTVDDLDFLKRGGRISPAVAFLGGRLQIKPLLVILENGKLKVVEKTRGRKAAMQRLVQMYQAALDFGDAEPLVMVDHSGCPEDAEALAERIRAVSPAGTRVLVGGLSPIIGAHTGPGALIVSHFGTGRIS